MPTAQRWSLVNSCCSSTIKMQISTQQWNGSTNKSSIAFQSSHGRILLQPYILEAFHFAKRYPFLSAPLPSSFCFGKATVRWSTSWFQCCVWKNCVILHTCTKKVQLNKYIWYSRISARGSSRNSRCHIPLHTTQSSAKFQYANTVQLFPGINHKGLW